MAVDVLLSKGVPEERILFLNLIASPEGAANFAKRFPKLRVVTAFVDEGLDEKKYVLEIAETPCVAADHVTATSFPVLATSAIASTLYRGACRLRASYSAVRELVEQKSPNSPTITHAAHDTCIKYRYLKDTSAAMRCQSRSITTAFLQTPQRRKRYMYVLGLEPP